MEKNINELLGMCFDCESTDCALNNNGECRFPLVYERMPVITEDDGCTEGVIKVRCRTWKRNIRVIPVRVPATVLNVRCIRITPPTSA